ncbi:hypothetical protein OIY81_2331 [Cryptosporidium canis]|nr:hypothetical protein OIY81_2331 [Cryptosporidium canis]
MSGGEKSVKQLIRELVGIQVRQGVQGSHHESNYQDLVKKIECNVWAKILSKRRGGRATGDLDYTSYLDSSLSNIVLQSNPGPGSDRSISIFKDQRSKVVETQMFCFLPLFILSYNLADCCFRNPSRLYILQLMYILIGSLDTYSLDLWQDSCLRRVYQSGLTWRLNSIMQRSLSDLITGGLEEDSPEQTLDFKRDFSTFSSLIFKRTAFTKSLRDFWLDVISDFSLGIVTFRGLVSDSRRETLFDNEVLPLTKSLDDVELSRQTDRIAEMAFGDDNFGPRDELAVGGTEGSRLSIPKYATPSVSRPAVIQSKRSSLLASFMGNSDDESDNAESLWEQLDAGDASVVPVSLGKRDKADHGQDGSIIQIRDQRERLSVGLESGGEIKIVPPQSELENSKVPGTSLFSYFDGLSKLIKEDKGPHERENQRVQNLSRVRLPGILRRVSRRSEVEYSRKYLGLSWDQQYLSLNKTNKVFNESVLSVLTTERVKNCTVASSDPQSRGVGEYVWIGLDSVRRLLQGVDSEEFSIYPRRQEVGTSKSTGFVDDYSVFVDDQYVSVELLRDVGELSPWMNNFGQGDRFMYTRVGRSGISGSRGARGDHEEQIFLSQDLVSTLCSIGTRVHYLRSFAELLAFLWGRMSRDSSLTVREESVASIRILSKVIQEFLQLYLGDIELYFSRLASRGGLSPQEPPPTNSYLSVCILLMELSPAIEMLTKIFNLRSFSRHSETRIWKVPHGYFLLNYIYYYLWQFQMNLPWTASKDRESVSKTQGGGTVFRRVDTSIYNYGHILSVIYKCIKKGIFNYRLDSVHSLAESQDLESRLKSSLALNRSILKSIVPILLRILVMKRICSKESGLVTVRDPSGVLSLKAPVDLEKSLSTFFSDSNIFQLVGSETETESEPGPEHLFTDDPQTRPSEFRTIGGAAHGFAGETVMDYLKRNQLDFGRIYQTYFRHLDQAIERINSLEYNMEEYLALAFRIGRFLGDQEWGGGEANISLLADDLLGHLKEVASARAPRSSQRHPSFGEGLEKIKWRKDSNLANTRQLDNYVMLNGAFDYEGLARLILGLDIDLSSFRRHANRDGSPGALEIQEIGQAREEEDMVKLFQMIVLLEVISDRLVELKRFVGRVAMYIWCRKNTTDYNLYIRFSQGYLYDAFSEELQKLVWGIENNIGTIHFNIEIIKNYVVMIFERLDPKAKLASKSENVQECNNYDSKWRTVFNYCNGRLFNQLSLSEKRFIYSLTCHICQICLLLLDFISKAGSFKEPPKRPSSFPQKRTMEQDFMEDQRNVMLELLDKWKSNKLGEMASRLLHAYKSLANYISGNRATFCQENSYILYYISS